MKGKCLLAAMLVLVTGPAAAYVTVVKASGGAETRYRAKARLPDNVLIDLKRGERLTVLDNGRTLTFTGPARGNPRQLVSRQRTIDINRAAVRAGAVR